MPKATGPTYTVPFKRRRKFLTDYRKRLALVKSGLPRLVVRKSTRGIVTQIIISGSGPGGSDQTVVTVNSNDIKKYDWIPHANLPTAYLTGLLCGIKAAKKDIKKAVLDIGLSAPKKGSTIFAALKGAIDAGLEIPHTEELFNMERISGKHIAEYAKAIKDTDTYKKQFSKYIERGVQPENIVELFEKVKEKIKSESK